MRRDKGPYNLFDKWYRDTRHQLVKVRVEGMSDQYDNDAA